MWFKKIKSDQNIDIDYRNTEANLTLSLDKLEGEQKEELESLIYSLLSENKKSAFSRGYREGIRLNND